MSRRRYTPWLFALTLLLAWGSIWMATVLAPERGAYNDHERRYEWPAADMAGVRRVELEPALRRLGREEEWRTPIEVRIGGDAAPGALVLVTNEGNNDAAPGLRLERVGDTLFVRQASAPGAAASAASGARPGAHGASGTAAARRDSLPFMMRRLDLPASVDTLVWSSMSVRSASRAPLPSLTLRAEDDVTVFDAGPIARLHVQSLVGWRDCVRRSGADCTPCLPSHRGQRSGSVTVNAAQIGQLSVDSADGEVLLSGLSADAPAQLYATPGTALGVARVDEYTRVRWQPLDAGRAAALGVDAAALRELNAPVPQRGASAAHAATTAAATATATATATAVPSRCAPPTPLD